MFAATIACKQDASESTDIGEADETVAMVGYDIRRLRPRNEEPLSKMFDRVRHPPRGRLGGEPGEPARVCLDDGTELRGMGRETIPAGARMVLETAGGGGRGRPEERDDEAIGRDRRDGLVS